MGSCEHPGKHPRFRNWQERATSDLEAIEEFWWKHKGANVAIATGAVPASSCWTSTRVTAATIRSTR
jgi:hypothetical protein